ncbi:Zn-dependent hydrolase, glyoxylase [Schinkia azotoformans MEV2011]|uniref:Zn-dependent hydrolase, glyoxylase n=1 Tax=Schinkia azotoformans MEV2011 TaxID=1348973 RepID=A0A072NIW5_SCHAZ|nr:MBL fold metallo-hydrolase [Schinkia azotoformans]KEF37451.1 Zn-dependent hydrolase, glyoxylase [Schinkia azotoformans MEV2011]MEC1697723.1 MBL fold metallo-hydrolase [Schinkia azotoformans]MEC1715911.1 MBL fold metallo-hydrolase [Schinkia azotoformans]MEC1726190.1 MBL fold metallo-hydrolase [Schinkia azotoformans]MEC1741550.1 MBL fold metallo-hydrolase [Schinkia azotoformans]
MPINKITAREITEKVLNKENLFVLDVRNATDFNDWKIEGENFEYLNVPYFELIDGIEPIQDKLPTDKEILVVCAKEGSSMMVAEFLDEAGFSSSYLEGGMKSWSEFLHKTKVYEDQDITVYQFVRVGKGCLSYMVVSDGEALIVDPSRFVEQYEAAAGGAGAKIKHIVDSHLHADHISGGKILADKTGADYYLMKSEGATFDFIPLEDHEKIVFNNVTLEVLAVKTPGHTPGSVSFFVNNKLLFSGDTIFVSGLGRPDLGNKVREWAKDLYNTVYSKVSEIADDVIVLPGHYASLDDEMNASGFIGATLGDIRKRNEKMFNTSEEEFLDQVEKSASSVKPPNFEEIVSINRGMVSADVEKMQELEIGPNRCAVHHAE